MDKTSQNTALQIGERIKERRNDLGLSMNDLAKRLGVNKSTIQRYETKGIEAKKNYLIVSLADALETTVEWLTGVSDKKTLDTKNLCEADIQKHISACIENLTVSIKDEPHQQLMTTMLGRFVDMFAVLCGHFGTAMNEIEKVESDKGLKTSLMKYALSSADIAEKVYRQEMEQPIEDFKKMADCLLSMFDKNSRSIIEISDILETAKRKIDK